MGRGETSKCFMKQKCIDLEHIEYTNIMDFNRTELKRQMSFEKTFITKCGNGNENQNITTSKDSQFKTKTEHTLGWKLIRDVLQAIRFAYIPTYIVIVLLVWQ